MTENSKKNSEQIICSLHNKHIDAISLSQKGVTRIENQDRSLIKEFQKDAAIAVVADGIGGASAGDVAAQMAISGFVEIENIPHKKELDFLSNLFKKTDNKVLTASNENPLFEDMGTTLIAVVVKNKTASWAHIGDSRLFLFRKKRLKQITRDQTFARFLLEEGEITKEQAPTHYSQHILDQCIGHGGCEPETGLISLKKNDLLLLSTDGLHKILDHKKIEIILNSNITLEQKVSKLHRKTIQAQGNDDITSILLHIL